MRVRILYGQLQEILLKIIIPCRIHYIISTYNDINRRGYHCFYFPVWLFM